MKTPIPEQSFLHQSVTEQIIGAAIDVHNTLGNGFLEKVYENSMSIELKTRGIDAEQQKAITVQYKNNVVGEYIADLLVGGTVLVELKAVNMLTTAHHAQMLNYLKATQTKVGLLINFGANRLEWKRFIL